MEEVAVAEDLVEAEEDLAAEAVEEAAVEASIKARLRE